MAFVHGKTAVFKIDNSGGSLQDISAYCDNVDFPLTSDTAEVTTFGDASKEYIAGLKDATVSISGSWDATADGILAGIVGVAGTFEYGPAGSAGGAVKFTGEAICTSYNVSAPVGDKVSFSAEFQCTGAITRTTF
jgi:predicted secreted protein